jgi:protein-S-isoprenylcysteine O-methyltransferase Ste14
VGFCIHLFVLLYEEPHLQKIFGDSYDNYRRQVSRWVPSIRKER